MAMEEINEKIMHYSRLLRLPGFRKYYQSLQTEMPDDKVDYNEYLSKLLELEYHERKERRKKLQIRQAGFPQLKYLGTFKVKSTTEPIFICSFDIFAYL